jgi:hypothetical protein
MKIRILNRHRSTYYLLPALFVLIIGLLGIRILGISHADTFSFTASEAWNDADCSGSVNGAQTQYYGVSQGDSVNLSISNTSSTQTLNADISSESGQQGNISDILPQNSVSNTFSFNQWLEVNANSTTCSGANDNSFLIIEAAAGSLACNLVNAGQDWNVTGNFTNIVPSLALYNNSQFVGVISATFQNNTHSTVSINGAYGASPSGTTYYLYNGSSSSSRLIGQATCPPATPATSSSPPASGKKIPPANTTTPTATSSAPTTNNTTIPTSKSVNPINSTAGNKKANSITKPVHSTANATKLVVVGITTVLVLVGLGWLLVKLRIIKLGSKKTGLFRWF